MNNTVLQAFVTAFEKCAADPESALAAESVGALVGGGEKTAGRRRRLLLGLGGLGALTGGGLLGLQALGTKSGDWEDYLIPNPQAIAAGGERVGQLSGQLAAHFARQRPTTISDMRESSRKWRGRLDGISDRMSNAVLDYDL
jgi:hypothetical protein